MSTGDLLHRLAFDNSLQANIIIAVSSGKIITANKAACKLLGYSKKDLLTKNRKNIFDINESSFKKMLKQRTTEGHSIALVKAIKKSGRQITCEITSAVFMDEDGIEKSITTIADRSQTILDQKTIDTKKEKVVADNISLAKAKQKGIDTKNERKVADNIILAKSKQKSIDTKKERVVAANITLAKSKQKSIDTKNEKKVADNIRMAQAKSDKWQAGNTEWIKLIAEASYDVMWDWNKAIAQIYVGGSIEEVFGYKVQNNQVSFTDFTRCLLPDEKYRVEEKLWETLSSKKIRWEDAFSFKRQDGTIATTISRATIIRDNEGNAIRMIGAIQDVSRLQELENKLHEQAKIKKEYSEIFQLAAKLSYDGIWDWNLLTNEFFLGEGFEELFGYDLKKNSGKMADWSQHLHPDDKEAVENGLKAAIESSATKWEHAYRFIRSNGSIPNVFGRASIIRLADGTASRMIGAIHDLSRQNELEEKLQMEIELKESQIADATKFAKETERSDIGKELHDNINQLLSVSKLYIELVKGGGKNSELYLSRSFQYIAEAIEEIRKLTKGLTSDFIKTFGLSESIENLIRDAMEVNKVKITCAIKRFDENNVTDKFKINVFRIVQEQLTNISKHAKATKIDIQLLQSKKTIKLSIADNGVGFDTRKQQKGIGIANIQSRANSYKGRADFISQQGKGCILEVIFPVTGVLLK
jgi:PAS domain S-box-containing protein